MTDEDERCTQPAQIRPAAPPGSTRARPSRRLRMRTLVTLGVLAVATALLGRTFGLHDCALPRLGGRAAGEHVRDLPLRAAAGGAPRPRRERPRSTSAGCWTSCAEGDWHVIHDASLGRGNVDHILIGPAGVFTVETKSHPGPVRVGRVHGATLGQAHAQRRAIERVDGHEVEPLIVFSRAWVDRPLARRKGVRVLPARMLIGYLTRRPATLSAEEIETAHGLLDERAARAPGERRGRLRPRSALGRAPGSRQERRRAPRG